MNAAAARSKSTNMRWYLAIIMFAISFVSYMDRVNLSVAVPVIMKEFHFTKIEIGWMQTAFFLGYALMQIPGGMLSERFGHRRIAALGVTWWSAFTALTAFGSGMFSFVLIRACSAWARARCSPPSATPSITGSASSNGARPPP